MNWLAHFVLSPARDRVRLGNWLADLFSREELKHLSDLEVQFGLNLHRVIDTATDRHPRVRSVLTELPSGVRRAGGIVLDVYWDHFLSREFAERTGRDLDSFVDEVLGDLERTVFLAPPGTQSILQRMKAEDWLRCYATAEGVEITLTRISHRLSSRARASLSPRLAREFLMENHDHLAREFSQIWTEVSACSRTAFPLLPSNQ